MKYLSGFFLLFFSYHSGVSSLEGPQEGPQKREIEDCSIYLFKRGKK